MLRALFSRPSEADSLREELRAMQATVWGIWPGEAANVSEAGPAVTTQTSMQLLAVYGSARLITDGISTLPMDTLRDRSDGTTEKIASPTWLEFPLPDVHRTSWLSQVLLSLLFAGNAFIALNR